MQNNGAPDPDKAEDLAEFIAILNDLRDWAGSPSYRDLAKAVGRRMRPPQQVSTNTVVDAFKTRRRRLNMDLVLAIVRALGVEEPEVDRWRAACARVHTQARTGGPQGVLRQLPPALATFTGRVAELRILTAADSAGPAEGRARTVVICAVQGMAGVGKTQLALQAAHTLVRSGRHEEVQLYANLRGFDPDHPPADPSAVLASFLRRLGVAPPQVPESLEDRAAMFRDRTHGRDVLVVLDNAADERQVRDLIPASHDCLVLITSRRSMAALDDAVIVMLDVLDAGESVRLLTRIVGADRVEAEPRAAERIGVLCGGLPLAISLVAALLRSRPAWSLQDVVKRLDQGPAGIAAGGRSLAAAFDLSCQGLAEPERRVFWLLGLDPGLDVTAESVTALAGIGVREAEQILERLQDEHLLQQQTPGRFELHDLLRAHAAERAATEVPEADRSAAVEAVIAWYTATAIAVTTTVSTTYPVLPPLPGAERVLVPAFEGGSEAMRWYEQERANLLSVEQAAGRLGLGEVVWQLATALARLEGLSRNWPEIERVASAALPFAQGAQRPGHAAPAELMRHLASALRETGRPQEGISVLIEALDLCRTACDRDAEARVLGFVVFAHAAAGQAEAGLRYGLDGLRSFEDDELVDTGGLLNAVAACLLDLDRAIEAAGYLDRYVHRCRTMNDQRALGLALHNLGEARFLAGLHGEAEAALAEAIVSASAVGDRLVAVDSFNGIARTLQARDRTTEAWERHRQGMALLDDLPETEADRIREQLAATPLAFPADLSV